MTGGWFDQDSAKSPVSSRTSARRRCDDASGYRTRNAQTSDIHIIWDQSTRKLPTDISSIALWLEFGLLNAMQPLSI
ncbi:hypothetical protein VTN31DRAFT_6606 [Thermomyces dupontii]|uniref:uncharacterized protein n=1 Tax=Talaromyces thermophilus TaxID=28565 RepID=UPI003743FC1C